MGGEILFALIHPVALTCAVAGAGFWYVAAEHLQPSGRLLRGYAPLAAGFAVSMIGVVLLAFVEVHAGWTWMVEQGHYSELKQALYFPRNAAGMMIANLVVALPLLSFAVVPFTARLITTHRLTPRAIAVGTLVGWIALSVAVWGLNLTFDAPRALTAFLGPTLAPVLIVGLPIPLSAVLFLRAWTAKPVQTSLD